MAEIYLARVSGLGGFEKNVVVKRILPQLANDHQFIEMFLDEARIAATLQHPNIVQMYDIGAADGNYFIAMEFLHGEDVRSIMRGLNKRKEPLPMAEALNIMIGVSSGLHYAHERRSFDGKPLGIIHRDVTPQNVIVTYDGGIKLVDFGIAKASNRLQETRYGTLKGKIAYMSPEQCQGAELDRRSDVFALGIMLYELTTNLRLYRGTSDFEIMKQIVEQPIMPPTARRPQYPIELEHIVLRALEKEPGARYQTAQDLQADIEAFVRDRRLVVSPIAMSSFMHMLFSDRIEAFERAAGDDEQLARQLAEKHGTASKSLTMPAASADGESELALEDLEELDEDEFEEVEVGVAGPTTVTPDSAVSVVRPQPEPATPSRRRGTLVVGSIAALALVAAAWFGVPALIGGEPSAQAVVLPVDAGAPAPRASTLVSDAAAPTTGSMRVVTSPEGASIELDGEDTGLRSPATLEDLAPGKHVVRVYLAGHLDYREELDVVAGKAAAVDATLKAEPVATRVKKPRPLPKKPVVRGTGELRVASRPSCELIIDGVSRGQTPLAGIMLSAGTHRVQLINSRYRIDKTYKVEVKADDVVKKRYTFDVE